MKQKKINLGCGTNKLPGWDNYDMDLDITKPLPFENNSVDYIFMEHVIEHITYEDSWNFFIEVNRVLKPGGIIRIITPSIVKQYQNKDNKNLNKYIDYFYSRNWIKQKNIKSIAESILFGHGHKQAWSEDLLSCCLNILGFNAAPVSLYISDDPNLCNLEGHWKVVGKEINDIDSICVEGKKVCDII